MCVYGLPSTFWMEVWFQLNASWRQTDGTLFFPSKYFQTCFLSASNHLSLHFCSNCCTLGVLLQKKQNVYVPHPTCNRITCVSFSVLQCVLWDGWRWLRRTWLLERAALLLTIASDSCPTARMTSETPWASGERWGVLPQMGQKTSLQFDLKDLEGWSTKDYRVKAEQG